MEQMNVARLMVKCLEEEGVKYVFGLPGEENIHFVNALHDSKKIRFILVRHEQGASFMADVYGRISGQAGVCASTLGPGAINLLLGVTDANTDSVPVVAFSAQVGINRIYKETHQYVDVVNLFKPVTKTAAMALTPESIPEMIRAAFDKAQAERPGAAFLAIPQDIENKPIPAGCAPVKLRPKHKSYPDATAILEAVNLLKTAKNPIMLIGYGAVRNHAETEIRELCNYLRIPTATTFMAKGVVSDREEHVLGTVGFMKHDYENFAFDKADVILAVGYELEEFAPATINPDADKKIIHINTFIQDIDACYSIDVSIEADIAESVKLLTDELKREKITCKKSDAAIKKLVADELNRFDHDQSMPVKPQKLMKVIRDCMKDDEIVIADTGAVKMWMARLYPTYEPNTCMVTNGLSTMSYALPGAIGAHFAKPGKRVLAVTGDGSFMMNSQEMETAVREKVPLKILIWEDKAYGLIKWKMDMDLKMHSEVDFTNPDFVKYAESFGARGYRIEKAEDLEPTIKKALDEEGVSLIVCPVDYSENVKLTDKLGELKMPN